MSSGLNAIRVTVRVWPASGCPTGCHVCVSYMRTTACSGVVALHAVATYCLLVDTARAIDYWVPLLGRQKFTTQERHDPPHTHVQRPFRPLAKESRRQALLRMAYDLSARRRMWSRHPQQRSLLVIQAHTLTGLNTQFNGNYTPSVSALLDSPSGGTVAARGRASCVPQGSFISKFSTQRNRASTSPRRPRYLLHQDS